MIKVQNNTATREPIPAFLQGLAPESLADLSWTDPALGVSDAAWWPEEIVVVPLEKYQRYGDETLVVNHARKVVVVNKDIIDLTQEEIDDITAEEDTQKQQQAETLRHQITSLQQQLATLENQ